MNKKLTTDNRQPTTGKFLGILILLFVVCGGLFVSTPIIVLAQDTTEYTLLTPIEFVESSPGKATANSYIPGFIKLIIAIAGGLAVIQIIFGGIKYMSTDAFIGKSDAKTTIQNAIWGLALVLSAWLILFTLNPKLVTFDFSIEPVEVGSDFATTTGFDGGPGSIAGCFAPCVEFDPSLPTKTGICRSGACEINEQLNYRLTELQKLLKGNNPDIGLEITEGFPPSCVVGNCRIHTNPCHYNGTCVDANFGERSRANTPQNIKKFIDLADSMGLRAEYEVSGTDRAAEIIQATGLNITQVKALGGHITGEHFSIYLK